MRLPRRLGRFPFLPHQAKCLKIKAFGLTARCEDAGDQIREQRIDLGLSKVALAKQLRVHRETLKLWEQNKCTPSSQMIQRIKDFLDRDLL